MCVVSVIDTLDDDSLTVPIKERFGVEALTSMIVNFDGNNINEYDEMVRGLAGMGWNSYGSKMLDLNVRNMVTLSTKPSNKEPLVLEHKALLSYLYCVFLGYNNTFPVFYSSRFN